MIPRLLASLLGLAFLPPAVLAQGPRRPIQIDEFLALDRAAEPQVSPDGRWVVYTVTRTDLDSARRRADRWLAAVDATSPPRPLSDDSPWTSGARHAGVATVHRVAEAGSPCQVGVRPR